MEKRERATTTSRQYSIKAVCAVKSRHFASVRPEQKKAVGESHARRPPIIGDGGGRGGMDGCASSLLLLLLINLRILVTGRSGRRS